MKITDPRTRFPDLPMTEEEAQRIMRVEKKEGLTLQSRPGHELALKILRADDEELVQIISYLEALNIPTT